MQPFKSHREQMAMQTTEQDDFREAMIEVWNSVKPSEAKDLKVIVASEDGRFAGIYSCDLDQHGDRFFILKEKPRSKTWTMASNLVSHLEDLDAVNLGKSARQSVNEFREIIANPSAKYEPAADSTSPHLGNRSHANQGRKQPQESGLLPTIDSPLPVPSSPSATQLVSPLKGQELLARVKDLEGRRPEELARLCGYFMLEDGQQIGDTERYYSALFEAHSG